MARIAVRVTPRGGRDAVEGFAADGSLRIRVAAAPADGRANEAAARLLARRFGIAPTRVRLVAGGTSRVKSFDVEGLDDDAIAAALQGAPRGNA